MESQNLDNQFKKIIESSENQYQEYSDRTKNYIWHQLQKEQPNVIPLIWKRLAVAASLLFLLSFTFYMFHYQKQKDEIIENLSAQVKDLKNEVLTQQQKTIYPELKIVTVEKERIVNKPIIKTEIIETIKLKTDTIFIKQPIIDNKALVITDTIVNPKKNDNYQKYDQQNISSQIENSYTLENKTKKKTKEKWFKIRFGGDNKATNNTENNSFAITAKL
jgi:hypothetical protein